LSSAILYAAIIAIWLGVLIPRWLRRDTSQTKAAREYDGGQLPEDAGDGGTDVQMSDADNGPGEVEPVQAERGQVAPGGSVADDDGVPAAEADVAAEAYETDSEGRTRVLAARRRMLIMLATLTVVALGMVFVGLAAWWVALPPIAMLGGYLMLLREASRMDTEQALLRADAAYHEQRRQERAERAAATRAETERVAAERAAAERRRREEEQSARIIDISGRVKDELYDQYADEKRAVGD
jgi:hypothetical protein